MPCRSPVGRGKKRTTIWVSVDAPHYVLKTAPAKDKGLPDALYFEEFGVKVVVETPADKDILEVPRIGRRLRLVRSRLSAIPVGSTNDSTSTTTPPPADPARPSPRAIAMAAQSMPTIPSIGP